jgi:osmoprotectant transport system permease protein
MKLSEFFLVKYGSEILQETSTHLLLVGVSIGIATLVGIPLGILITRKTNLRQPILGIANILQTIPSLALFGFLISVPIIGGIGAKTAIIALTLYSLLPNYSQYLYRYYQRRSSYPRSWKRYGYD